MFGAAIVKGRPRDRGRTPLLVGRGSQDTSGDLEVLGGWFTTSAASDDFGGCVACPLARMRTDRVPRWLPNRGRVVTPTAADGILLAVPILASIGFVRLWLFFRRVAS